MRLPKEFGIDPIKLLFAKFGIIIFVSFLIEMEV